MNLNKATQLATDLINQNCPDYTFKYDRAIKRFGSCNHSSKLITLSTKLTELNSEEEVKNTLLHEIAHALAGPHHGHDWLWAAHCRRLGIEPRRCYDGDKINKPLQDYHYKATCPNCGREVYRIRRPKRLTSCGRCSNRFNPDYILTYSAI